MDSSLARYDGKLFYVANLRVPSEKAHVLQSFKMCEAFAGSVSTSSSHIPVGETPLRWKVWTR